VRNAGATLLYPIDGGAPKTAAGISETDQVIGGSEESDVVYVSLARRAVPKSIWNVNIRTGQRRPFVTLAPSDPVGIVGLGSPIFSADKTRYIFNQFVNCRFSMLRAD
jgi:hypothetical protein